MKLMIDIDDKDYELINKTGITIDWGTAFQGKEKDREMTFALFDLAKALKNGTPVYEQERPQGEWIEVEPTKEDKEYGFDTRIVCSRCYEPDSHYDYDEYHKPKAVWYFRPKFCPNCGADMRGKDND